MLAVPAGSVLVANYSENGHVTKDKLAPDGKPHPGQYVWYLSPNLLTTLGDLAEARRASAGNFDDGLCAEDATVGRLGPRQCQSSFVLPGDLAAGTYSLVWLWTFPKVAGVVEMYSSCMDVEILSGRADASADSSLADVAQVKVVSPDSVRSVQSMTTDQASTRTSFITETVSVYVWPTTTTTTKPAVTTVGATDAHLRPGIYTLHDEVIVTTVTRTVKALPTEALIDGSLAYI